MPGNGRYKGMKRYPKGIDLIKRNECPINNQFPLSCMVCALGHSVECHYPYTCLEAECSAYKLSIQNDNH